MPIELERLKAPFRLVINRQDGYRAVIEDTDPFELTVTVTKDGRTWSGKRKTIDEAVMLAGKIAADQDLITQMKAGDHGTSV